MKNKDYKSKHKAGEIFRTWELVSYINGGGNGEVWICKNSSNEKYAIKLLKSVKLKSYQRFKDETKIIKENMDIEGIIPIVDNYLPADQNLETPYYVMPIAVDSRKYLRGKNFDEKIQLLTELCWTIKKMHERRIAHRDIKSGNILFYKDRLYLSDFGLVEYPDKKNISSEHEEIGPKWTMAPEMKRESMNADGLKADIYSLAKTVWIILTEYTKGFDGQYTGDSVIGLKHQFTSFYTDPLDQLLTECTNNDPDARPTIVNVIRKLERWKVLNEDFHERNQNQWYEIQKKLFPINAPSRAIWYNLNDIISILKIACSYNDLNHMFFPTGGGLDLIDARLSYEVGCIELDFQLISILKPKRLIYESFGFSPEWNYFRLEADELKESGVNKLEEDETEFESYDEKYDKEEVSELLPGMYYPYHILEDPQNYSEQYDIPEDARTVERWFRGSFVIFNKRSTYNRDSATYDGRHNKMSADNFRNYIKTNIYRINNGKND